jgi:DNA-binding NarL/FixJ family response regulator
MADANRPLVGREAELREIEDALAAAAEGRPSFLILGGEAGAGKSRLVLEAAARADAAGRRVLLGGCLDIGDGGLPFLPIAEMLRTLVRAIPAARLDELVGPAWRELALISPALADAARSDEITAPAPVGEPSGALGQARLFERLLQLLSRLAAAAPSLVVIEDVQWIDRSTRDLLVFLARNLTTERLLIVLTQRIDTALEADPGSAWLADLARSRGSRRLVVPALDRRAVAEQLRALTGESQAPELVEQLWRRSDGNPMFIEELVQAGIPAADTRPRSLDEMLLARVSALSPEARRAIDAVAVAARPLDEPILATVLDATEQQVVASIREGLAQAVLMRDSAGRCLFRHELLREVVEDRLLPSERRALHERFAAALQIERSSSGVASGHAAELAYHWLGAGRTVEAFTAALAAAAEAQSVFAHVDALRFYERAIELEAQLPAASRPSPREAIELRRRASDAADLAGSFERARELVSEALAMTDPVADPVTAGRLHARLGYLGWAAGLGSAALEEHREAARLIPADPPSEDRARVLAGLASALFGAAQWAESRDIAVEAIAAAEAAAAPYEESRARNILGSALVGLGEVDAGIVELQRARELAQRSAPPNGLIIAYHNLALNLLQADRFEEALGEAQAGIEVARRSGLERRFGLDLAALAAEILVRLGRWQEADATTSAALELDPQGEGTIYLATVRGRLAALLGEADEARRRLESIDRHDLDADVAAELAAARAEANLLAGDPDAALEAAEAGLAALAELDEVLWTVPLLALAIRAAASARERAAARHETRAVESAVAAASRLAAATTRIAPRSVTASTAAWLATAVAEHRRGEGVADPEAWAAAADAWRAVPDRYRAAEAMLAGAEAALRVGGIRAEVAGALRGVHLTARELGARPLAAAAERLASRARIELGGQGARDPAAAPPTREEPAGAGPDGDTGSEALRRRGLSTREIEVLRLVAAGLSNGEIADRLFISRKTAAVHVTHILDKLGVANRIEAALVAERAGLRA